MAPSPPERTGPSRRVQALAQHLTAGALLPGHPDPDGLLEYSVVYTDRAVNHMSKQFQGVMTDLSATLKKVYNAHSAVIVPGSGSYGMESVARQFGTGKHVLVIRNGYFSFRWTDILDRCKIPSSHTVLKARPNGAGSTAQFAPCPVDEVVATIHRERPALVCCPHVETSAGLIVSDDYIRAVARATHAVGGLFVLDCIASGCLWVDMVATEVDVLISAPQKGWSGPPCAALVMLSPRAHARVADTVSTSMVLDLKTWLKVMETYETGGHMYYTTMPTEALRVFRDVTRETALIGFDKVKQQQQELGKRIREVLEERGFKSVAAPGWQAPSVVVSHTDVDDIKSGKRFVNAGVQIASGVPLMCDEHPDYKSFRIGLFGLDKLSNIPRTVRLFAEKLDAVRSM
eukprot:m.625074 g.625074  ORF g.625074 m.625074 type:complete len:402 (-) comp22546_c0_seq31:222-1427(-)